MPEVEPSREGSTITASSLALFGPDRVGTESGALAPAALTDARTVAMTKTKRPDRFLSDEGTMLPRRLE